MLNRILCNVSPQYIQLRHSFKSFSINFLKSQLKLFPKFYCTNHIFDLSERGLWHDRYPASNLEFQEQLKTQSLTVYSGFDPTADALHIGHLLVINALIHFQTNGHKIIVVVGGATSCIGDPSGKKKERPILELQTISRNKAALISSIKLIFANYEKFIWSKQGHKKPLHPVRILDNYEWHKNISFIDCLRNVGKHMKMSDLLKRSVIHSRLSANETLSYTEFSYQILQAYDWLHLYREFNCTVQIGGSDQMGNIASGHYMISRLEDYQVTGITVPLIKSETGDKLGKTSGPPVWLSANKTSPFEFYQYFLSRIKDSEVENYLKLLTFISLPEIKDAMDWHKENSSKRHPHRKLAEHLTLLVHGEEGLAKAKRATDLLFGGNSSALADMDSDEVIDLYRGSVIVEAILKPEFTIFDMAILANCFPSEKRAIEVIEKGGFHVNQAKVTSPQMILMYGVHILPNKLSLLRVGKKNHYIIRWTM